MVAVARKSVSVLLIVLVVFMIGVVFEESAHGHGSDITVWSSGFLSFSIPGAEGLYPSERSATLNIASQSGVQVNFYADPLSYRGPGRERYALDVTYLVEDRSAVHHFKPGNNYTIRKEESGDHQFVVSGVVEITGIEKQPAGPYQGTIWVTVSALGH